MKRILRTAAFICILAIAAAFTTEYTELSIGAAIPKGDVKMLDAVSGKEVSLADVKGEKGLLVIFSCNTCPYVGYYKSRIKEAALQARRNGIGVIIINSNEAKRDDDDSFDAMKKYAAEQKFDFPYVVDVNSEVANAFGATKTPHVFLFDNSSLVYKGAIDDNPKDAGAVKERYLRDALGAVMEGKEVKINSTKSIGCTIKRKE